jgi:hypothetical protein
MSLNQNILKMLNTQIPIFNYSMKNQPLYVQVVHNNFEAYRIIWYLWIP